MTIPTMPNKTTDKPGSIANDLMVSHALTPTEIAILKRLPSVKDRKIDIDATYTYNQVIVLKNSHTDKIVLLSFYHNFGDFIYVHTMIGRNDYKHMLFEYILKLTTPIAPTYFITIGSEASIESTLLNGGEEIYEEEVMSDIIDFAERINLLTGTKFYWDTSILKDHNDIIPVKIPVFRVTEESFQSCVNTFHSINQQRHNMQTIQHQNTIKKITEKQHLAKGYQYDSITLSELYYAYHLHISKLFGKKILPFETIATIYKKNSDAFFCIKQYDPVTGNRKTCFVGSLIPLTQDATDAMKQLKITGLNLTAKHVLPKNNPVKTIYTALIMSINDTVFDRAASLVLFAKKLLTFSEVLTVPATPEGLKLTRKMGFIPTDQRFTSDIGTLHILDTGFNST
ncbi:MAG: hypothetical protein OCD01_19430 [Fibrobacterales bacterium]